MVFVILKRFFILEEECPIIKIFFIFLKLNVNYFSLI